MVGCNVNSYAYVKSLIYGVEGNTDGQPYLKRARSVKKASKVIKGNFQYKVDTSSKGRLIVKCKDARCLWRISAYRKGNVEFRIAKDEVSHQCDLALLKDHYP
ncbi:hypothetical protein DVH24_020915 [Malus domestica]|uniref:Transposase MuDR plant domain-containing protein n=1 Tax=Malus domestica TaxID=3750 RepID=A0A498JDU1_MALDO|nr:hypothetical protein DVH24_020915 [Malus domestica]